MVAPSRPGRRALLQEVEALPPELAVPPLGPRPPDHPDDLVSDLGPDEAHDGTLPAAAHPDHLRAGVRLIR